MCLHGCQVVFLLSAGLSKETLKDLAVREAEQALATVATGSAKDNLLAALEAVAKACGQRCAGYLPGELAAGRRPSGKASLAKSYCCHMGFPWGPRLLHRHAVLLPCVLRRGFCCCWS